MMYLEYRDMAEVFKVRAKLLASVAASDGVDWKSAADKSFSLAQEMVDKLFPYYAKKDSREEPDEDKYEKYFKMLKKLDEEAAAKKKEETAST